ncbi:MAG TPA: PEP-CTERM sorting domain-containing protein [Tepidisphaeraceae bacterium]|nr:PEP-CTERM sorting domain-containing protein [Tepidisphaeraceae bacterium]
MRCLSLKTTALVCGAVGVLAWAAPLRAQIVNPTWNLPNDGTSGTDTTAETNGANTVGGPGWYLSPAPNPDFGYTNNGFRDTFYSVEASGWSFWIQTFTQSGFTNQTVAATAGTNYTFTSQMSFQDGSGPGMGYNATTLANQTEASPPAPNTGDLDTYLEIQFENATGGLTGRAITNIPAGSVTTYAIASGAGAGSTPFLPYSVSGTAGPGTTQAVLTIGWQNGGLDGGTGGQSAFADDEVFAPTAVPEPASLSLLGLGGLALLSRRRRAQSA